MMNCLTWFVRFISLEFGIAIAILMAASNCDAEIAPPQKILRAVQQTVSPGPIDPAQVNSVFGANIIENIFEPMLQYDYLARPLKLIPLTLREMPEVQEEGRVYICRLKAGIYFADDPVFKSKRRELIAADYAYSIRRLFDPAFVSSQFFMVDGKIAGADAVRKAVVKSGQFDYNLPIKGLQVMDRYSLRIELTAPDLNFLHVLAQQNLAAVAREVVEAYGADVPFHPVGTGPFILREWRPGSLMVFDRNRAYRNEIFSGEPGEDAASLTVAAQLKGRNLPMLDRVELAFTVESQPMWLTFMGGDFDYLTNIPNEFRPSAIPNGKLAPSLIRQGVQLQQYAYPALWYTAFNMRDPVIGGYTPERIALRRAIALAFDGKAAIDIAMYGGAVAAHGVVPPGVAGNDPAVRTDVFTQDIGRARALLDTFGYIDRNGDGWREDPQGKPLNIELLTSPEPRFVVWDEIYSKTFAHLGIRLSIKKVHQTEAYRMRQSAQYQIAQDAWNMDFPDGEDFYIIHNGAAAGTANTSQFALPAFDALFAKSQRLKDSPERNALYRQMDKLSFAYMPTINHIFLMRAAVVQPWLIGYMPHAVHLAPWKYLDIDVLKKAQRTQNRDEQKGSNQ